MHSKNLDLSYESNPWYNDDCKEAIKQRKDTLSRFYKFPTKDNLNTFRYLEQKHVRPSNHRNVNHGELMFQILTIKKVWDMVRKISGKSKDASHQHLIQISTEVQKQKQPPKKI